VNLCAQASPAVPDGLLLRTPFGPEMCWWARTMVESTPACSLSTSRYSPTNIPMDDITPWPTSETTPNGAKFSSDWSPTLKKTATVCHLEASRHVTALTSAFGHQSSASAVISTPQPKESLSKPCRDGHGTLRTGGMFER